MASPTATALRDTTINLRVNSATRDLIDSAAEIAGKSRSQFILDSARQSAEAVLLDQRLLTLAPDAFEAFTAALDAPVAPNAALRKLMNTSPPWDR